MIQPKSLVGNGAWVRHHHRGFTEVPGNFKTRGDKDKGWVDSQSPESRKEVDWGAATWEEPETDGESEIWVQGARDSEEEEEAKKGL